MERDVDDDFSAFVAGSWPGLVRTAYLLTGQRAAAEDLVQASLVKCLGAWRRGHVPDDAHAYARTVMLRQALRWRKRRWTGEQAFAVPPDRTAPDATDDLVLADAVRAALRDLPIDQRAVLVLRYWEQRSESEIAALLGVSPGTVKSRASRGLAALRATGALRDEPEVRHG